MTTTMNALEERFVDLEAVARQRSRAVRAVASASSDSAECRELLAALGLDPEEGRQP